MNQALHLSGGRVIDGTGADAVHHDVLLVGDEIRAVGPKVDVEKVAREEAATLVDVTGCTVMPGLIDAHCHVTFGEPSGNDELFFHRDQSRSALVAAFNVQKLLLAGVTGFLDADCIFDLGPALRDAIEAGLVDGPRMSTGLNALLTSAGGTAGRLIPDSGRLGYAHVMGDRAEMIRTTREQIKYGADWIKVHVTGLLPGRSSESTVWSSEELRAVVDTAHELDTPVVAHCRSAHSTQLAAESGVDLILHASYVDKAGVEAILTSGAAVAPTFTFLANLTDYGHLAGAASAQVDIFRGEIEATAEMLRTAHDQGATLLCGSESGFALTPYGHWHAREAQLFVERLGLSELEALRCATYNGAIALRRELGSIGVIKPGAAADVIVTEGDPTSDIAVLGDRSKLRSVISRGNEVNLDRPWPERSPLPGEKIGLWSTQPLTRELTLGETSDRE